MGMCTNTLERVMVNLFECAIHPYANNSKTVVGDNSKLGIKFCVYIRSEQHGYERDGNTHHEEWCGRSHRYVHVIIKYPHDVFVAIKESHEEPLPQEYQNVSNHNSCYRSSIPLSEVAFTVHDEAWANTPKEHIQPPIRSVDMEFETMFKPLYQFVEVETERCEDGYQNIISITPKNHEIHIKD